MPYLFKNFNKISYDLKKNNKPVLVTNILNRFKFQEIIKNKQAIYYDYIVKDSDLPYSVAHKFYGDASLDWLIYLINDIIDPLYDWPLNQNKLEAMIRSKYGSVSEAMKNVHHYEQILSQQKEIVDSNNKKRIIKERSIVVDLTTYNSLTPTSRRSVSNYQNEVNINESKRKIKLLDDKYLNSVLNEFKLVLT